MSEIMPHAILAHSPDSALESGLWWLKVVGNIGNSRNGKVLVAPSPVVTVYERPDFRVMASPLRDANPFFHFFESLWMLAGRNEAAKVATYAKQMEAFADDGLLWGAYGFRWRHFFGFDQLRAIINMLALDPSTRRAVLTMWAPTGDLVDLNGAGGPKSKDVPCNTQIYFDASQGRLNMTVSNRSNDVVWGAYGANLVHMSMLHEFVARATGLPLGVYYQFSNNFHIYPDRPDVQRLMDVSTEHREGWMVKFDGRHNLYAAGLNPYPLMPPGGDWDLWLHECEMFVDNPLSGKQYSFRFFNEVAWPLMVAHAEYKRGDYGAATGMCNACLARDWGMAAREWVERRRDAAQLKQTTARSMMGGAK